MLSIRRPATHEPLLFNSKPTGLGFRFRSLFRSNRSLEEEMTRTLNESQMHLSAFLVQRNGSKHVPHSALHSLGATHIKTILTQLNDNTWYKTFSTLDLSEYSTIHRILHPYMNGKTHERELVVLKVIQEEKTSPLMALMSEVIRNRPLPRSGRVLLAICREKLVDGKPLPILQTFIGPPGPPPPPPPPQCPPPPPMSLRRNMRHPPLPPNFGFTTRLSVRACFIRDPAPFKLPMTLNTKTMRAMNLFCL